VSQRLKQGNRVFRKDYFDELLERIREIRASEQRFLGIDFLPCQFSISIGLRRKNEKIKGNARFR
jgi:hypothetical protein